MGAVLHSGSVSQPCLRKALKGSCPRLPQCCTAGVHLVSLTRPQLGVIACPAPRPLSMLSPCLESLLASPHPLSLSLLQTLTMAFKNPLGKYKSILGHLQ